MGRQNGERTAGPLPGGRRKVSAAEDAMLLRAVEPLKGCQCPLLDAEPPFLHIPAGRTGESEVGRQGSAELLCSVGYACCKDTDERYLSPNVPPAHLLENPVSREPQLKIPQEEADIGGRFQLNRWKSF